MSALHRPIARAVPAASTRAAGRAVARRGWLTFVLVLGSVTALHAAATEPSLRELMEQNRLLREQAQRQQVQLEELKSRVERLARESADRELDARDQGARSLEQSPASEPRRGKIIVSGMGSLNFFAGQSRNKYSNREFRVDEARLFVEAEVRPATFLYGELILSQREALNENFQLGEYYLEQENILGDLLEPRLLNLRAGRIAVPFGEEYQVRSPVRNPLITHSVTDFWGVDEGIALYGEKGGVSYAFAVQNGGISRMRDWHKDKALVGRIGWNLTPALYLSTSAMRTGKLDAAHEFGSEVWIGNAVFRSVGQPATTRTFEADLGQVDLRWRARGGHVAGAIGTGRYRDDDVSANNRRTFDFFQIEAAHDVIGRVYAAARYSELRTDRGYYLAGLGSFGDYFLGNTLTRKISRLGVGGGYRFSGDLNLKFEYTFENARRMDGSLRPDEDQFAAELAVKF
ncbi:MAG: hypothetical protein JNL92_06545 [Opitutaceae bacterium]|nr:hypothetical protein [Opitutaceae bacterium]